jgi:hypothetical protein
MSTYLHTITNEEFISVVFRDAPQDAVPWGTGFKEDPISVDGKHWAGAPVTNCALPGMIDKESNNFMAISTFYRKEEVQRGQQVMRYRRRKENFAACHLIMIDDVGTKIQPWQIPPRTELQARNLAGQLPIWVPAGRAGARRGSGHTRY